MVVKFKYAVVHWYNYRKELHAGFSKGFDDLEEAKKYAFEAAEKDMIEYESNEAGKVITEDEITDGNGPGKDGSPYAGKTIVGYGGRFSNGYSTTFYCVVPWFPGVMNDWDEFEEPEYWDEKHGGEWYPIYDE